MHAPEDDRPATAPARGGRRPLKVATALLGTVCSLGGAAGAFAAGTFYVDGAHSACSDTGPGTGTEALPYCTLSAAAQARGGPGTTLLVKPAVYREQVSVPASGAAGSPFVFQALGAPVVVDGAEDFTALDKWSQTPYAAGNVWLAASVTWSPKQVFADGARLTPSTALPDALPPRSFRFILGEGLYVHAGGGNPGLHQTLVGRRLHGFRVAGRAWVTIAGFTVTRTEDRAIYIKDLSANITIANNAVTFANGTGIQASGGSGMLIAANLVSDNHDHGIGLSSGVTGSTIQDNEAFRNARPSTRAATGLDLFASSGNLIQRNRFHDNQDTGLNLRASSDNNLSLQNLSWNNGDHGFDHVNSKGTLNVGNVAWENFKDGFSVEGTSTGTKIFNSIGVNNGLTTNEYNLWVDATSAPGFISNSNVFWNATSQAPIKYISTAYATLAAFTAATGHDAQSLQADPRFVDPAGGDFRLLEGSPAIDSADSSVPSWPATDAAGQAREDDPATPNTGVGPVPYADRGALEFQPSFAPLAALTVSPASGAPPLAVTADASGSIDADGTIVAYRFDFGDGTVVGPQAGATAPHTYGAGTWTATVTATDNEGKTGSASATVVVEVPNQAPVAALTVSPSSGTAPLPVTADASGSSDPDGTIVAYRFDFGDGTVVGPQAGATAPHTYGAGTWTATVTVTDNRGGNSSASATVVVAVPPPDLAETALTDPPSGAVPGGSFTVTDTVQNAGAGPSGGSTTRYYLATNPFRSGTDIGLTGSRAVPGLAPGATSSGTAIVTIPPGAALGTYYLLGCADDTQAVAESNEANNCRASVTTAQVIAPPSAADEIHWTITGQTSVTFDWRGPTSENIIRYGTSPGVYANTVTAVTPSPLPDSSPGPFWEARLTGLLEDTLYYYQIGAEPEHTFRTPPPRGGSGFWIAEQADIGSANSYPTVAPTQSQIAADNPNIPGDDRPRFVLVAGDLTYGDQHGVSAVDDHFNDVMVWSRWAAYMPAWGNHENGSSVDDRQNYEGRFDFPNSQESPNVPPKGGRGEEWYWFDYGNVRFISYPEPFSGAWTDWKTKADPIVAAAQGDPAIAFIVTFGHRPAYSSGSDLGGEPDLAAHMQELHSKYSKYVLNIGAHSHHYERSDPAQTDGLVHIVGAGGGATLGGLISPQPPWSVYRINHLAHLRLHITANRIEGFAICGPGGAGSTDTCTQGTVIDTWAILAPGAPPENTPPAAALTATPASGTAPLAVNLDASGSSDPDGTIVAYRFDFGDGTGVGPQAGATATHTYGAGTWTATVTVTDDAGATSLASQVVTVTGNQAPNGLIDTPAGNTTITAGQSVSFSGTGSDPDSNLPLTHRWTFGGAAADQLVEDPGPVVFPTPGTYPVTFTVTDSLGLADPTPDSRVITVVTANLLTNGGFEAGQAGWTNWSSTSRFVTSLSPYAGAFALQIDAGASNRYVQQTIAATAGVAYTFSFALRTSLTASVGRARIEWLNSAGSVVKSLYFGDTTGVTGWTVKTTTQTAPIGTVQLRVSCYVTSGGSGSAWFDEVTVR